MDAEAAGLRHHVEICRNAVLPGRRRPFLLGATPVGYVAEAAAAALLRSGCHESPAGIVLDEPARLAGMARDIQPVLGFRWREEAFDVRAGLDGPVLTTVDRGALPSLGLTAQGAHVNGLVRRPDGLHVWVARRAADRPLDPGKLDHLAAGGIATGGTPRETAVRELGEEAGVPPELAAGLRAAGTIDYAAERPEGLRRDRLHCFDLTLPDTFAPVSRDGEVAGFELWPAARVLTTLRNTNQFKFNVALVLIELLVREGLIAPP